MLGCKTYSEFIYKITWVIETNERETTTSVKLGAVDRCYHHNIQFATRLLYTYTVYTPYIANFIDLYLFIYITYVILQPNPRVLFYILTYYNGRSLQWPRGLRSRSAVARLLRLWVRIPLRAWMSGCCERCVLSGRGLCDELITRPEESYRLWCVDECDLET
jgi:hypothetical protein